MCFRIGGVSFFTSFSVFTYTNSSFFPFSFLFCSYLIMFLFSENPFDERDFDRDTPKRIQDEYTEDDKPVRRFGTLWRAQGTSISSKATTSSTSAFSATGSRLKRDDYQKNLYNRPTFNASVRATDVKSRRNDPIPMLLSMEWPDDSRSSLDSNSCEFDLSCRDSSVLIENPNPCRVSKAYSRSRPWSASARNVQNTRKHSQGPSDGNDTSTDSDFDDGGDNDDDDDDADGDGDDDNSSSCNSDVSDYQVDDVVARLTSRLSIREQRKIRKFGASTPKEKESLSKLGPEQESQSENRHLHGERNSSSHTHDRNKTRRKESILSPWDDDDSVVRIGNRHTWKNKKERPICYDFCPHHVVRFSSLLLTHSLTFLSFFRFIFRKEKSP